MSTARRIPKEEGPFNLWLQNFNINLPSVAEEVGVAAAAVARIAQDAPAFDYLMLRNAVVRAYKGEESKVKERALRGKIGESAPALPVLNLPEPPDRLVINAGIWDFANGLVQQIVKNAGFTPEIEALLDIAVKDDGDDLGEDEVKGFIKEVKVKIGAVTLMCSMQGFKSYRVYSQRGTNPAFEVIGDSTQSEFDDERPNLVTGQPESRQYKIVMLENNKPVGDFSAIETAVTKP